MMIYNVMKHLIFLRMSFALRLTLFLCCLSAMLPGVAAPVYPHSLRIVSYNIRHGEGLDGRLDFQRLSDLLEKQHPDIVAVQEVDSCTARCQGRYGLGEMAGNMGYFATFGPAITFDGGKYGVGLLSRQRPLSVRQIPLPGREETRTLLIAEFADYVFASTHLSLEEVDRLESAVRIAEVAAGYDKPFLIAGDWNDLPSSPFMQTMSREFQIVSNMKGMTYPADKPEECLDYIAIFRTPRHRNVPTRVSDRSYSAYINEPAVVRRCGVLNEPVASDHRPVFAEISLPTPALQLMTTEPYLQLPTPTSMDVMFQTNSVCHCWVEYGTDSLNTRKARTLVDGQEVCYDIENRIRLENLQPGTRYYYRVCVNELLLKRGYENHFGDTLRTRFYSFRTPGGTDDDFSCLVFNDLHDNRACFDHLLNLVGNTPYDFVIFNGDCLSEPSDRDDAIRLIHSLADRVNGAEKPVIFLRGNHEIRNNYSAGMHSLIGYFDDHTYGAFTWGDTRFVLLDCGEDKPDDTPVYAGLNDFTRLRHEQVDFLRKELKGKPFRKAAHRVLLSHIPVFGNSDDYHPSHELWASLLEHAPFDFAVGAHTHEIKYYPQGVDGCRFPVFIGGGPSVNAGCVCRISQRNGKLQLEVLTKNPENRLQETF